MKTLSTPRFYDLHLHGAAGIDFMHAEHDAMAFACEHLGSHGTGVYSPTLLTSEPKLLKEACARWGAFLERCSRKGYLPKTAALPVGLHLEGPFLNPKMAGAHPGNWLSAPKAPAALELVRAAQGHVAIVTLAPELEGALPLIRALTSRGIRVQMGHTVATSAEALRGARAGATGITHLYNAMRTHHRDPGVLAPLRKKLVTAEIITDGLHLDPEFVLWCWAAAGSQLYAVSDGCSAVGAPKRTKLTLGSLNLERRGKAALVAETGTLAGGATYLADHPCGLATCLGDHRANKRLLGLFHETQSKIFPKASRSNRGRNYFDSKSLKFLGSEA